jgi:ABC-type nitrate/sulfonate/bicarbonate transport system substrate-binding protein
MSKWMATALVVAGLATTVAACGDDGEAGGAAATGDGGKKTLRVAFASQPDFTQVMNFKWLDDLEAEGVEVETSFFESSQDAFRAMIAGEADMAVAGIVSAVQLVQETGEAVKVVAVDLQAPDYLLMGTQDMKSLADMEGNRIGISTPGDISDTLTRVVLRREGVDVDKVRFVEIGGTSARMAALQSNQIQGGAAHAAEGLAAAENGLTNLFAYGESVPDYAQHGIIVSDEWLGKNKEFAQQAVDGFIDSIRWASENKAEYIELSRDKVEGLSDTAREQAYDIFKDISMFALNGGMDDKVLDNTIAIEKEVGNLGDDAPPASDWADSSLVENYLEREGAQP